jgi:predicted porin
MKKTLIALAALASVGAASAQSSVTLSGTVAYGTQKDMTVSGKVGRGLTQTDAFFVLSGTEDIGGGLVAKFDSKIEAASESRGNAMNRVDTGVSLTGGFGQVSLRNTRSSDLLTNALVAPTYLPDGIYDDSNVLSRVKIDVLTYALAFGGGFTGSVSYLEQSDGKATATTASGFTGSLPGVGTGAAAYVLGGGYAAGPLDVKLAYKGIIQKVNGAKDSAELSVTYDFGMAKVGFGYDGAVVEKNAVISVANNNVISSLGVAGTQAALGYYQKDALGVGVSVPFGAFTVGANYAVRGKAKLAEAVAKYNFSKRTAVIASWGKQNADAAATNAAGGTESNQQYRVALRHDF